LRVVAPAKINLFLWVGERREDGLHEVSTVMQSVSLADELVVSPGDDVSLDVTPPGSAPEDESNLVVAAVRALRGACARTGGAALALNKRIPAGAGLGGGSADAAATLVGLNELWGCGLSKKALEKIAASIGADVPFCVRGGTAGGIGAGERLGPLVLRDPLWWVIAKPAGSLATAEVYARFDELGGPRATDPDPVELADALARGDLQRIGASLRNDLEPAAEALRPGLGAMRGSLLDAGALAAVMSGSGPAWCGLARDEAHAREIASLLSEDLVVVVRSEARGARIMER
jgi:4-diphosphocytidyl-2-C-methyl-D-erythritol kinase